MPDVMNIEVLEDGTIKITTDSISPANHANADEFMELVGELGGGVPVMTKTKEEHHHYTNTVQNRNVTERLRR